MRATAMPMKRSTHCMPPDYFCRQSLELSLKVLQPTHPQLASCLKDALNNHNLHSTLQIKRKNTTTPIELLDNLALVKQIRPETVGEIMRALTGIAHDSIGNPHTQNDQEAKALPNGIHYEKQLITVVAYLMEDWAIYIEWILRHSRTETPAPTMHIYH